MTSLNSAATGGNPLPRLWRVETALLTVAARLADSHRATVDLIAAYDAPERAVDHLATMLGDNRAALVFAANELRTVRHQLSKVLP